MAGAEREPSAAVHGAERSVAPAVAASARDRPRSSPLARRLARELGVDWTRLAGSGCTGRIRKVDVLAAASAAGSSARPVAPPLAGTIRPDRTDPPDDRRADGPEPADDGPRDAQHHGGRDEPGESPRASTRRPARRAASCRVTLDIVVKLTAMTLREHPMLHARWDGDHLVIPDEPHIGIAVDTEEGLLVPVIRGAAGLGLGRDRRAGAGPGPSRPRASASGPTRCKAGRSRSPTWAPFGVETFTPIINPPECAVLGMGRIVREPVMIEDRVVGARADGPEPDLRPPDRQRRAGGPVPPGPGRRDREPGAVADRVRTSAGPLDLAGLVIEIIPSGYRGDRGSAGGSPARRPGRSPRAGR